MQGGILGRDWKEERGDDVITISKIYNNDEVQMVNKYMKTIFL